MCGCRILNLKSPHFGMYFPCSWRKSLLKIVLYWGSLLLGEEWYVNKKSYAAAAQHVVTKGSHDYAQFNSWQLYFLGLLHMWLGHGPWPLCEIWWPNHMAPLPSSSRAAAQHTATGYDPKNNRFQEDQEDFLISIYHDVNTHWAIAPIFSNIP